MIFVKTLILNIIWILKNANFLEKEQLYAMFKCLCCYYDYTVINIRWNVCFEMELF